MPNEKELLPDDLAWVYDKEPYVTIRNPVAHLTGAEYSNGQPVVVFTGERVDAFLTLKNPVMSKGMKNGELVDVYISRYAMRQLDSFGEHLQELKRQREAELIDDTPKEVWLREQERRKNIADRVKPLIKKARKPRKTSPN